MINFNSSSEDIRLQLDGTSRAKMIQEELWKLQKEVLLNEAKDEAQRLFTIWKRKRDAGLHG